MPNRTIAVLALVVVGVVACSSDHTASPTTTAVATVASTAAPVVSTAGSPVTTVTAPAPLAVFEPAPIEWEPFNDAVDVGTLEVPVDYADPAGERFELFLARYHALDQENKIGTLLVNPGGPGFGGATLALNAADQFDQPLRERFDIVGWDPRGTGDSDPPIDCIDDYDRYFAADRTPADGAARAELVALAEEFAEGCADNATLPYVGTNNSARDIDAIRQALGEETISYFGFSYGSELGATWATLFPKTVRAMVIDGASDPTADMIERARQQWRGFEAALTSFLAECSDDDDCAFHNDGDAEGAFDALMAQLDVSPIVGDTDRPLVNRDVALDGVARAMYSDEFWPALAESLADALEGDGGGLLALSDSYYQRSPDGEWGDEIEAFQAISCADSNERSTVDEADATAASFTEVAPRFVPRGAVGDYSCTFLPPTADPRVAISTPATLPIVVVGTTGDAATPLDSSRRMSETLGDGRLVVVTANQHTGYNVNQCVIDVVNGFLVDLEPPADETACE